MTQRTPFRNFLAIACALAAFASCQTLQRDVFVEDAQPEAFADLDGAEFRLVSMETRNAAATAAGPEKTAILKAAKNELAALLEISKRATLNAQYSARLLALQGRARLISGDKPGARSDLAQARKTWKSDELAAVLDSLLSSDDADALEILDRALAYCDDTRRIQAERGRRLLSLERPRDALVALDEALPYLPEVYALRYGVFREMAMALKDVPDPGELPSDWLSQTQLSLVGMCAITQDSSPLLNWLTGDRRWDPVALFDRLKTASFFIDPNALLNTRATRSDAAFFIWKLLASHGGNQALLQKYTQKYAARPGARSPVPDVPLGAPYFDAVLGCVEMEIMNLDDGRNFMPDAQISGAGF